MKWGKMKNDTLYEMPLGGQVRWGQRNNYWIERDEVVGDLYKIGQWYG